MSELFQLTGDVAKYEWEKTHVRGALPNYVQRDAAGSFERSQEIQFIGLTKSVLDMGQTIIVVGGGIAGISCLEALVQEFNYGISSYDTITLISESRLIKKVKNLIIRGRNLETFDVAETELTDTEEFNIPNGLHVEFVVGTVIRVDTKSRNVIINSANLDGMSKSTHEYSYDYLSICVGAAPKKLDVPGVNDPSIWDLLVTIRDTTSIDNLRSKLNSCSSIAIIGNGGIGLGLVDNICGCEIIWITRDEFVGYPFLDSGASKFFIDMIDNSTDRNKRTRRRSIYRFGLQNQTGKCGGPALGPDWLQQGDLEGSAESQNNLVIIYNSEIESIKQSEDCDKKLSIKLSNGRSINCDLVVTAIGVKPNTLEFSHNTIELSDSDGGIIIDDQMRTSVESIYAAGDVVSCERWQSNPLWFQMRLWTQARQMGYYCGRCIASHLEKKDPSIYATFDCFTHITEFFGKRVVLLGQYDANVMDNEQIEGIARVRLGHEYVRLTLRSGVIIGAILVGDTELEETIENLMHDAIDVSQFKDQLLEDTIDIQDYFD